MNVNAESYWQYSAIVIVSSNSSSVSFGKPTIISVDKATLGIVDLNLSNYSLYDSAVYLLPILLNTELDPDCNGRWIKGMMFLYFEITSNIS